MHPSNHQSNHQQRSDPIQSNQQAGLNRRCDSIQIQIQSNHQKVQPAVGVQILAFDARSLPCNAQPLSGGGASWSLSSYNWSLSLAAQNLGPHRLSFLKPAAKQGWSPRPGGLQQHNDLGWLRHKPVTSKKKTIRCAVDLLLSVRKVPKSVALPVRSTHQRLQARCPAVLANLEYHPPTGQEFMHCGAVAYSFTNFACHEVLSLEFCFVRALKGHPGWPKAGWCKVLELSSKSANTKHNLMCSSLACKRHAPTVDPGLCCYPSFEGLIISVVSKLRGHSCECSSRMLAATRHQERMGKSDRHPAPCVCPCRLQQQIQPASVFKPACLSLRSFPAWQTHLRHVSSALRARCGVKPPLRKGQFCIRPILPTAATGPTK
ncbi:unnamed protein product [Polarella glacialis]|uniref:Uncharacterized protein n=1 Tax=Polarella glacialis TaxID=89957 RepID=A0A813J6W8_POLGL|nr:unnamed protein product [Polarella glacialis]